MAYDHIPDPFGGKSVPPPVPGPSGGALPGPAARRRPAWVVPVTLVAGLGVLVGAIVVVAATADGGGGQAEHVLAGPSTTAVAASTTASPTPSWPTHQWPAGEYQVLGCQRKSDNTALVRISVSDSDTLPSVVTVAVPYGRGQAALAVNLVPEDGAGPQAPTQNLNRGQTRIFDLTDYEMAGHPDEDPCASVDQVVRVNN